MGIFSSSIRQYTGKTGDKTVKVDVLAGKPATEGGTTIDGDSVSVRLTVPHKDAFTAEVEKKIISRIEQDPSATDHNNALQIFMADQQKANIMAKQGTAEWDGKQVKQYEGPQLDETYADLSRLSGDPDFLPDMKETLTVKAATTANAKGAIPFEKTVPVLDAQVNPYEHFYNDSDELGPLQSTIGGTDLSVFYMAEYPNMEDVIEGILPEAQRKELVIFELDSALSLSYSILRERFPVRTIGRANPITFTRGSRTIAGHIAFAVFAEDVLTRLRSRIRNKFDEIRQKFNNFNNTVKRPGDVTQIADQANYDATEFEKMRYFYEAAFQYDKVQLLDSLPQFHLLVMGVNERGLWSKFIIKNVSIVDENQYQGTQQPNIVNKVSWVATDIVPMASFRMKGHTVIDSLNSIDEAYSNGKLSLSSNYNQLSGSNILDSIKKDLAKDTINSPAELLKDWTSPYENLGG